MENENYSISDSNRITTLLMIVAVVAVGISAFNVFNTLQLKSAGYASSDRGNVTFEILSNINVIFNNSIINWSIGYVNTTSPCPSPVEAQLTTNATGPGMRALPATGIYCGVGWIPQLTGLTLQSDSNVDIKVNISSNQNALNLIDGGNNYAPYASNFQWKVFNNETNSCNTTIGAIGPLTYTEIVAGQNVTLCDVLNWGNNNDIITIDFLLNISSSTSVLGERKAIITASAERSTLQDTLNP
jgi:hypothetical protein